MQGIPTDLYEAAQVDGASSWTRFWNITLPMMTPVLFFQLVTGFIAALQIFTQAFIMTSGGPNNATLFFLLYLYRNAFEYFRMGYASALAWVLFIYILVLTLIFYKSSDRWVYYEGDDKRNGRRPRKDRRMTVVERSDTQSKQGRPMLTFHQRDIARQVVTHHAPADGRGGHVYPAGLDIVHFAEVAGRSLSLPAHLDSQRDSLEQLLPRP